MQDSYIGDIGDYGKYGLLRTICDEGLSLSINWYKVVPKKQGKQDDGKFINYLNSPQIYADYDPELFYTLHEIVCKEKNRSIKQIEQKNLFPAKYFSEEISTDRDNWHKMALNQTYGTKTVFLDPDNGLETNNMFLKNKATSKHVSWSELKDYYSRGQNVILYQHRPQMTKKEDCINGILQFQNDYLKADSVMLLEFPKYTNRFYFMFLHKDSQDKFQKVCNSMIKNWCRNDFCREIII